MVDYIVTSHMDLKMCAEFKVYTPTELVERLGSEVMSLIDDGSRLPDHSVLCLRFQTRELCTNCNFVRSSSQQQKRLNRNVPVNFLSSAMCQNSLLEVINELVNGQKIQENIDICSNQFCDLVCKEVEIYGICCALT